MLDRDQKNINLLFERVMTGGPDGGKSDRHRMPPFASDIVGDKQITFKKDPGGLGAKLITMYQTFGAGDDFNQFAQQIQTNNPENWDSLLQFLTFVFNSPSNFKKEVRDTAANILDIFKSGWRQSDEDNELPSFDEITDDIKNHPGRQALERHKREQQKGPVKINIKAGEEYLKKQLQKRTGQRPS